MYGLDLKDPNIRKAYKWGFNDGYTAAVDNAREEHGLTEDQAGDLLTELVDIEGENGDL